MNKPVSYYLSFLLLFFFILVLPITFLALRNYDFVNPFADLFSQKAKIIVSAGTTVKTDSSTWKALAQGGEEPGRMLANVLPEVTALSPRYIRLDHIYDFYDVVHKNSDGSLSFDWQKLDATVCDIYSVGAKPFLSLGYMPPAISKDGSLIREPSNWDDWSLIVQKTIERYSGSNSSVCSQQNEDDFKEVYYEVWNEPDLDTFGSWTLTGSKSYLTLYSFSIAGASKATNVNSFFIGGPAVSSLHKDWILGFLDYVKSNNLRLDFVSWHRYAKNPDVYESDLANMDQWLLDSRYNQYYKLPRVISEWGYDSLINEKNHDATAMTHTLASLSHMIRKNLQYAFTFEIKDGPHGPSWGILSYDGHKKPRYQALEVLKRLKREVLLLTGETAHIKAIATKELNDYAILLINYDDANTHVETVPITVNDLKPGDYTIRITNNEGKTTQKKTTVVTNSLTESVTLSPNSYFIVQITKL